jgi:hypothetical protein
MPQCQSIIHEDWGPFALLFLVSLGKGFRLHNSIDSSLAECIATLCPIRNGSIYTPMANGSIKPSSVNRIYSLDDFRLHVATALHQEALYFYIELVSIDLFIHVIYMPFHIILTLFLILT